ncbi:MAG: TetR family transcriptional regulator C-terminal domain-containing protein, partial [Oscillospiraceae bacterium]|nr:TetR family transcriptional regulator C-terminal domain-containing protein [Oscillospiraceae bacterium]
LLRHLQENDFGVLDLLGSANNELFLRYFKEGLKSLVRAHYAERISGALSEEYLINHIAASFVETLSWWLRGGRTESPEQLTEYFLAVTEPLLK